MDFGESLPMTHYMGMAIWPDQWEAGAYKALSEVEAGYFAMGWVGMWGLRSSS